MDFLSLSSGCNFSGTNGPNGFIGNDDLGPVFGLDSRGNGFELRCYNRDGLVGFSFGERFTAAQDYVDVTGNSSLYFGGNKVVAFCKDLTTFRVAEEGPGDIAVCLDYPLVNDLVNIWTGELFLAFQLLN